MMVGPVYSTFTPFIPGRLVVITFIGLPSYSFAMLKHTTFFYPPYSTLKLFTGFINAARNACTPTVSTVTTNNAPPASKNTSTPILTR
jgi:hypothetical protein